MQHVQGLPLLLRCPGPWSHLFLFHVVLNFGGFLEYSWCHSVWESLISDKSSQLYSLCEFVLELLVLMKMPLKPDRSTLGSTFVML